jgi:hypothetical protein
MYHGLTAAAGPKKRLQSLREKRGEPILSTISMSFRPNADSTRELT